MSFKDIFKKSFLSGYSSSTIDTKTIIVSISITALLAIFVFFVYRIITRKTFYNKTFNISLVAMAIVTAAIILTIQSNVVLSLGMVGALSIVRFRTAIKDPLDLVFLYWAISLGIICGAGLSSIAIVLCIIMALVVFALQKYPDRRLTKILIVGSTCTDDDIKIMEIVQQYSKFCKVKSKNLTKSTLDLIIEVVVHEEKEMIHDLIKIEGVVSASLLAHDGEVTA